MQSQLNAQAISSKSAVPAAAYQNPYAPPATANEPNPAMLIAIAVAIAIVGLLIGKFAL